MMIRLLLLCLVLAGCTPGQDVISRYDDWTGFNELVTPEYEIFRDRKAIMTVRPVVVERGGVRSFGVLTNIRRRVPNGPIVEAMYSSDIQLQYQKHDRLRTHCLDGCQRAETGVIHLTEAAFRAAARTGLPVRVFGRRGRYEGVVPGVLFQQVLDAL
jgi:hypothetical protein